MMTVLIVLIIINIIAITTTTIINLDSIAQFDTNGILTALHLVKNYIQMHNMHK